MEPGLPGAAKLGAILGLGWTVIFAGCLLNIRDATMAVVIASTISLVIVALVFTANQWVPDLVPEETIEKLGGEEDETDP